MLCNHFQLLPIVGAEVFNSQTVGACLNDVYEQVHQEVQVVVVVQGERACVPPMAIGLSYSGCRTLGR